MSGLSPFVHTDHCGEYSGIFSVRTSANSRRDGGSASNVESDSIPRITGAYVARQDTRHSGVSANGRGNTGLHASHALDRRGAILYAGVAYGIVRIMETDRKITVQVPQDLLEKAQRASRTGITQTVRTGLQLVAASETYARLRQLRGKVRFTRSLAELKVDR